MEDDALYMNVVSRFQPCKCVITGNLFFELGFHMLGVLVECTNYLVMYYS